MLFWDMQNTLVLWPKCFDQYGILTFNPIYPGELSRGPCANFNYGYFTWPLYKALSWISDSPTFWVLLLSFLILIFLVLRISKYSVSERIMVGIVLISPPFALLFSSGNPDILNILILLISGLALLRSNKIAFVAGTMAVFVHKYYGLAAWALISIPEFKKMAFRSRLIIGILMGISMSIVGLQVSRKGFFDQGVDAANNHYGLGIWDNYLRKIGVSWNENLIQFAGLATLIVLSIFVRRFSNIKTRFLDFEALSNNAVLASVFYSIFLFSYIVTANVDYRLAFLGIAIILDLRHYSQGKIIARIFLMIIIASMLLVFPWQYGEFLDLVPVQTIGDLLLHIASAYILARLWVIYLTRREKFISSKVH